MNNKIEKKPLNSRPPKPYLPCEVASRRIRMKAKQFVRFDKDSGKPVNGLTSTVMEVTVLRQKDRILLIPDFHSASSDYNVQVHWKVSRPISVLAAGFDEEEVEKDFIKAVFDKWDSDRDLFLAMYPEAAEGTADSLLPVRVEEIPEWSRGELKLTYFS